MGTACALVLRYMKLLKGFLSTVAGGGLPYANGCLAPHRCFAHTAHSKGISVGKMALIRDNGYRNIIRIKDNGSTGFMSKQYAAKDMINVEEALEQILGFAHILPPEQIDMLDTVGRVLAEDVVSDIDIAPFDNSAMDGFAIIASDAEEARADNPIKLAIVGAIGAGETYVPPLKDGQALRIMTGAPMPKGADTVVKIEDTEVLGETQEKPEGSEVVLTKKPKYKKNVRMRGEEVQAGEVILKAGTVLNPAGVGLLASTGNPTVAVVRSPRVAVLSSGNELVEPSQKPGPGQIRNSNCFSLAAAVRAAGGLADILGIVRDDINEIRSTVKAAVASHDMVMISGGAAEGDFDYTHTILSELGKVYFSKVNMRPGKAQTLGVINDTIVFGLAGNPSAAMVGFEVLLRPALRKMQGFVSLKRPLTKARITADIKKSDPRRFYIRARLKRDSPSKEYLVYPESNQSSALLGAFQSANCLLVLPEGLVDNAKGETLSCLRLDVNEGVVI